MYANINTRTVPNQLPALSKCDNDDGCVRVWVLISATGIYAVETRMLIVHALGAEYMLKSRFCAQRLCVCVGCWNFLRRSLIYNKLCAPQKYLRRRRDEPHELNLCVCVCVQLSVRSVRSVADCFYTHARSHTISPNTKSGLGRRGTRPCLLLCCFDSRTVNC